MDKKLDLSKFLIIIPIAGYGKRMGKLGKTCPKSLLKLNKFKILEIIINILRKRKAKNFAFILGYKAKTIIRFLNKIKIKYTYCINKKYKSSGHAYSWYLIQRHWLKNKKKTLLIHGDIFFNEKYLDNIIKDKKKNIIGSKKLNNSSYKKKNIFKIKSKKDKLINEISKKLYKQESYSEIIGINKLSGKMQYKLFKFMNKEFKNKSNIKLSWEEMINKFINISKQKFYILKKQNYFWVNINTKKDYYIAKKFAERIAL